MKICYLGNAESIHVQRWVHYFLSKGHYVHLISLRPFRSGVKEADLSKLRVHLVRWALPYVKVVSYVVNLLLVFVQVEMLIRKIKPDILHAHYVTDYGLMGALTNFHPFIVSVWGSDVLIAPKESKISKCETSYALKRADCITTTAEFMKGYLVKAFGLQEKKIVRIPWGIDLKIFRRGYYKEVAALRESLGIKTDSPVILSNRNLAPQYEIESIIDAIPYVLKSRPDATFVFIKGYGTSEFENKMKLKVQKLGISHNVRFISKIVTPKEMAIYLNMADMCLSMPKVGQFGASILEGMICGSIAIVSDISVHRELLVNGENAFMVNPDDPKQIDEVIMRCIEHPEIKQRFYERSKNMIEQKWDWNKNARAMEKTYIELVKENDK